MADEKSSTRPLASTRSSNVLTMKTSVPVTSHTGASWRKPRVEGVRVCQYPRVQ